MDYDEWLTEMLIKHGVDRPHMWENHGEYADKAILMGHLATITYFLRAVTWYYTQEAVDYLKEKQYNGNPIDKNRSGGNE